MCWLLAVGEDEEEAVAVVVLRDGLFCGGLVVKLEVKRKKI